MDSLKFCDAKCSKRSPANATPRIGVSQKLPVTNGAADGGMRTAAQRLRAPSCARACGYQRTGGKFMRQFFVWALLIFSTSPRPRRYTVSSTTKSELALLLMSWTHCQAIFVMRETEPQVSPCASKLFRALIGPDTPQPLFQKTHCGSLLESWKVFA